MSAYNLQQIESAFSTQRDQYAKFETAVNATAGGCYNPGRAPVTPIIIAEDFSSPDQKKSVLITDDVSKAADEMEGESQGNICVLMVIRIWLLLAQWEDCLVSVFKVCMPGVDSLGDVRGTQS